MSRSRKVVRAPHVVCSRRYSVGTTVDPTPLVDGLREYALVERTGGAQECRLLDHALSSRTFPVEGCANTTSTALD